MMLKQIREPFLTLGWMLPALVPVAGFIGRGFGNTLFFLYFLWALLALRRRDWWMPKTLVVTYLVLLSVFALSITVAQDPAEAAHFWFRWATYTIVLPVTLSVLRINHSVGLDIDKVARLLAITVVVAVVVFLYRLGILFVNDGITTLNSIAMAFLFPFLIWYLFHERLHKILRSLLFVLVTATVVGLFFADSSTEILAVMVGMVVLSVVAAGKPRVAFIAIIPVVLLVLIVELLPKLSHLDGRGWVETLDLWSSQRTTMWLRAFQQPPENLLIGVGMGNAHYAWPVSSAGVKGFHNFLMDAWYETGILGLTALLAFMAAMILPVIRGMRGMGRAARQKISPWIAGIAAALIVASLDHSYGSVSFALFMPFAFAILIHHTNHSAEQMRMPE